MRARKARKRTLCWRGGCWWSGSSGTVLMGGIRRLVGEAFGVGR